MNCQRCGAALARDAVYCTACGALRDSAHLEASETQGDQPTGMLPARPWSRFVARAIDLVGFRVLFAFAIVALGVSGLGPFFFAVAYTFAWVFVEAVLMERFQTTPGKWLVGVTVQKESGQRITLAESVARAFDVWWKGLGTGYPPIALVTMLVAYRRLTSIGRTSWDEGRGYVVSELPSSQTRALLVGFAFLGWVAIKSMSGAPRL